MIYLDNAATTKMCKSAIEQYVKYAEENYFNPSAIYNAGVETSVQIENAKKTLCNALAVDFSNNIIFCSGATEADNLAILGCARNNFKRFVFSSSEHPAVYRVAEKLLNQGYKVDFIPVQPCGEIDYVALEEMLDEDVNFISVIHVCNETGAINDLKKINEIRQKKCPHAIFHSDGVQAFGKINVNLLSCGVDLYTVSAHKMHGPKGVAALYIKNKNSLKAQVLGGGQEYGLRSGTENTSGIMAFKAAVDDVGNIQNNFKHVSALNNIVRDNLGDICKYNSCKNGSPYILSLSFEGVNGETLVHMLEEQSIYISTGSACSSKRTGNRVLESMNYTQKQIVGSVRISFCKNNTSEEVKIAADALVLNYTKLKEKLK